nr:MAG TPA: Golgin subfamily A member 5 [Caudoviricetes sp.]
MQSFFDTKFRFRIHVPRFSDHHISLTRFPDQSFFLIIYVFLIHLFLFF